MMTPDEEARYVAALEAVNKALQDAKDVLVNAPPGAELLLSEWVVVMNWVDQNDGNCLISCHSNIGSLVSHAKGLLHMALHNAGS
jgi:hypothetical protein